MHAAVVVTGGGSGLGAATAARLRTDGTQVLTVDWKGDVDIVADLSTADGRAAAVSAALEASPQIAGVVSCAGLSPIHPDAAQIVSVNWFGAVAMLEELRPAMAGVPGAAAVAISSIGAAIGGDDELEALMNAGDEAAARATADDGVTAYSTAKRALARWVRHQSGAWGTDAIRLNSVAPGRMETPMLDGLLADDEVAPGINAMPSGLLASAGPDAVAAVVCFLLGPDAGFVHGQQIYVDGGSEAMLRPDHV